MRRPNKDLPDLVVLGELRIGDELYSVSGHVERLEHDRDVILRQLFTAAADARNPGGCIEEALAQIALRRGARLK